jgi:hypothetical protein
VGSSPTPGAILTCGICTGGAQLTAALLPLLLPGIPG